SRKTSPSNTVRADGVFEPVVAPEEFFVARGIIQERARRLSDEDLLAQLRQLAQKHSTLSAQIIDATEGMPPSGTYRSRFGSLLRAYRLAGFEPLRDYHYVEINRNR